MLWAPGLCEHASACVYCMLLFTPFEPLREHLCTFGCLSGGDSEALWTRTCVLGDLALGDHLFALGVHQLAVLVLNQARQHVLGIRLGAEPLQEHRACPEELLSNSHNSEHAHKSYRVTHKTQRRCWTNTAGKLHRRPNIQTAYQLLLEILARTWLVNK